VDTGRQSARLRAAAGFSREVAKGWRIGWLPGSTAAEAKGRGERMTCGGQAEPLIRVGPGEPFVANPMQAPPSIDPRR
jgi:hypothetical protein